MLSAATSYAAFFLRSNSSPNIYSFILPVIHRIPNPRHSPASLADRCGHETVSWQAESTRNNTCDVRIASFRGSCCPVCSPSPPALAGTQMRQEMLGSFRGQWRRHSRARQARHWKEPGCPDCYLSSITYISIPVLARGFPAQARILDAGGCMRPWD